MPEVTATAIRFSRTGGPDVLNLESETLPSPGAGELIVRHEAIGLNFIDTYYRSGLYDVPLPSGLGSEAAGVVEVVGAGVQEFSPGDRIGYFTGPIGAYSTRRVVSADRCVMLPRQISFEQAAAVMLKGCTAEYLIERCANVRPGQIVLVHAAAGGVGSILVQWLKAIGATVIAHCGNAEKAVLASELGADHSLFCALGNIAEEVRVLTGGKGVAVVFDGVGAASWSASLSSVARRGLIVSFGNASGPAPAVAPLALAEAGSIFLTRPSLRDYCAATVEIRASADRLFQIINSGDILVKIGNRFQLKDAALAHHAIEARATQGSSLLLP